MLLTTFFISMMIQVLQFIKCKPDPIPQAVSILSVSEIITITTILHCIHHTIRWIVHLRSFMSFRNNNRILPPLQRRMRCHFPRSRYCGILFKWGKLHNISNHSVHQSEYKWTRTVSRVWKANQSRDLTSIHAFISRRIPGLLNSKKIILGLLSTHLAYYHKEKYTKISLVKGIVIYLRI